MDPITKSRSLVGIIIFLLVSNIAMLIFFLVLGNGPRKDHSAHKDLVGIFLKKDMGFDQHQMDEYDKLHKENMESMKPLFDSVHSAKENFYNQLAGNNPDTVTKKSATAIGESQILIEMQMFKYFKNVRKLCTSDQLPKFDSSFSSVIAKMIHSRKPDPKAR